MVAALAVGAGKGIRKVKLPDMPGSPLAVGLIALGALIATAAYKGTIDDVIAALGGRPVATKEDHPVPTGENDEEKNLISLNNGYDQVFVIDADEDPKRVRDNITSDKRDNGRWVEHDLLVAQTEGVPCPGEMTRVVLLETGAGDVNAIGTAFCAPTGNLKKERPADAKTPTGGAGPHLSLGLIGREYRFTIPTVGDHEGMRP